MVALDSIKEPESVMPTSLVMRSAANLNHDSCQGFTGEELAEKSTTKPAKACLHQACAFSSITQEEGVWVEWSGLSRDHSRQGLGGQVTCHRALVHQLGFCRFCQ